VAGWFDVGFADGAADGAADGCAVAARLGVGNGLAASDWCLDDVHAVANSASPTTAAASFERVMTAAFPRRCENVSS
jgi:hypothetical protein